MCVKRKSVLRLSVTILITIIFMVTAKIAMSNSTTNIATEIGNDIRAPDVVAQFKLMHDGDEGAEDHPELKGSPLAARYCNDDGEACIGNDPTNTTHYQGIHRVDSDEFPYFILTLNGNPYTAGTDYAGELLSIQMGSKSAKVGEPLGTSCVNLNGSCEPNSLDKTIKSVRFNGQHMETEDVKWSYGWKHPGSGQVLGDILFLPLEKVCNTVTGEINKCANNDENEDENIGAIIALDISNPTDPRLVREITRTVTGATLPTIGVLAATKTDDNKYLFAVNGGAYDSNNALTFYETTEPIETVADMKTMEIEWIFTWNANTLQPENNDDFWRNGRADWIWNYDVDYQMINFIRDQDGNLYIFATDNDFWNPDGGGIDWGKLFRVVREGDDFTLWYVATKHFYLNDPVMMGDFDAAAGIYLTPAGKMILYTAPHDNDGYDYCDGDGRCNALEMGEFVSEFYVEQSRLGALAMGFKGEDINWITWDVEPEEADDAGTVNVIYSDQDGSLEAHIGQIWYHGLGIEGRPRSDDEFGNALVFGDFNCDTLGDLAIGIRGKDVNGQDDAGIVQVLYGTFYGLSRNEYQHLQQEFDLQANDHFGSTLIVGDFDNNGCDDLAIGVPDEDIDGQDDAGSVDVYYGSESGLGSRQFWAQGKSGIYEYVEPDDHFGFVLASGDFNGDGYDDLAVGVPGEDLPEGDDAGLFHVIYGSEDGLTDLNNQYWSQSEGHKKDYFGFSLAAGRFNNDGYYDLAIGIPGKDCTDGDDCGLVNVFYGDPNGFGYVDKEIHQNQREADDQFGFSLVAGHFYNPLELDSLAVGAPGEDDVGGYSGDDHGMVSIFHDGLILIQDLHQGILGQLPEEGDRFGASLAAGDINGDHYDDLAIGVPREDTTANDAGMVHLLFGSATPTINFQIWEQNQSYVIDRGEGGDTQGDDTYFDIKKSYDLPLAIWPYPQRVYLPLVLR